MESEEKMYDIHVQQDNKQFFDSVMFRREGFVTCEAASNSNSALLANLVMQNIAAIFKRDLNNQFQHVLDMKLDEYLKTFFVGTEITCEISQQHFGQCLLRKIVSIS